MDPTRAAVARHVQVAGSMLWPTDGDGSCVALDEVFAIVLLWGVDDRTPWIGWVTTLERRSVSFSSRDLEDGEFQDWLARLRGWNGHKLAHAVAEPGLHQVWRSPAHPILG
jgi:hypothetical protein